MHQVNASLRQREIASAEFQSPLSPLDQRDLPEIANGGWIPLELRFRMIVLRNRERELRPEIERGTQMADLHIFSHSRHLIPFCCILQ